MSNERDYNDTYKVLVLGESGVGKTSLICRFVENSFKLSYLSTIGVDSHSKVVDLGAEKVKLQIWDTAGQERFRTITSAYYRGAKGIILVYDVTTKESFNNISSWIDTIKENASAGVCCLLVGNKIDVHENHRVISTKLGQTRADKSKLPFFETSAKSGTNVHETFLEMAKLVNKNIKNKEEELHHPKIILERNSTKSSSGCC